MAVDLTPRLSENSSLSYALLPAHTTPSVPIEEGKASNHRPTAAIPHCFLHPTSSFAPPVACLLDGMACPTQGPFPGRKSRVKDDELGSQVKLGKMLGQRARKFKSYAQGYDAHQAEVKKSILTRFSKSIQVFSSQKH